MYLNHYLLLVLSLRSLLCAAWNPWDWRWKDRKVQVQVGCTLEVPKHVGLQKEAESKPLVIFVDLKLLGVRNVPDSGGSYEMDVT